MYRRMRRIRSFLPHHRSADEAGGRDSRNIHIPAVLERADVRECLYQQERVQNVACRCPGSFGTVYDRVGTYRSGAGTGDIPDTVRLYLPEQEDTGKLHRRRNQRLINSCWFSKL